MTKQTRCVLEALLQEPSQPRYGHELHVLTKMSWGTIYVILARLEEDGLVTSTWEDPELHEKAGRPRRRYYRLTPDGANKARDALSPAPRSRSQPRLVLNLAQPKTGGAQA